MQTKYALPLFASLLALTLGPACSQPEDPSGDDGNDDGNGDKQDVMEQIRDTGPDDKQDTDDDDNGGGGDDPDTGGMEDDAADFDPSTCEVQSDFTGQVGNSDLTNGGGEVASSTDVLPEDTGLQSVRTYIENNQEQASSEQGLTIPEGDQMEVSGAVVTATEGGKNLPFFYLQDQQVALYARLAEGNDSVDVKVGDAVSFTVTAVSLFNGQPQIQNITNFSVDSSGNQVPIQEVDGSSLSADKYQQLIRVGGALSAPEQCGGDCSLPASEREGQCWQCYDMVNQEGETIIEFRSNSLTQEEPLGYFAGTCMTFVGPLGMFPGPVGNSDTSLQIQETNWDWAKSASQ